MIRYGKAINQQCDLIVNPIYKNGKGYEMEQGLINLEGDHYEEYLNNLLDSNNFNDNVY